MPTDFHGFKGAAKRLDDIDLPKIGAQIGVGEDVLHAFMDAETSGSGFDALGRPKMLFEPHVFYRLLGDGPERQAAVAQGLAYERQGAKPYPKDSYPRLQKALLIDEMVALQSASWGLGQIMGENHHMVGYVTVQDMVLAFMDDEEKHLQAIVDYLKSANLVAALKKHDWAAVARGYNGPAYAKNAYDQKLAAAYAKWSKIRDTPYPAPGAPVVPPPVVKGPEPVITLNPNVVDLVIKAATAAAGAAVGAHETGKPTNDVIGAAVSGALGSASVQTAAVQTSTAVDTMPASKPWWQSTGVIGSAIAILAAGAGVFGWSMTPDNVQTATELTNKAIELGTGIVGLVGGVMALWGRLRAKTQITSA